MDVLKIGLVSERALARGAAHARRLDASSAPARGAGRRPGESSSVARCGRRRSRSIRTALLAHGLGSSRTSSRPARDTVAMRGAGFVENAEPAHSARRRRRTAFPPQALAQHRDQRRAEALPLRLADVADRHRSGRTEVRRRAGPGTTRRAAHALEPVGRQHDGRDARHRSGARGLRAALRTRGRASCIPAPASACELHRVVARQPAPGAAASEARWWSLVLLLFLRDARTAFISLTAIPLSLLSAVHRAARARRHAQHDDARRPRDRDRRSGRRCHHRRREHRAATARERGSRRGRAARSRSCSTPRSKFAARWSSPPRASRWSSCRCSRWAARRAASSRRSRRATCSRSAPRCWSRSTVTPALCLVLLGRSPAHPNEPRHPDPADRRRYTALLHTRARTPGAGLSPAPATVVAAGR